MRGSGYVTWRYLPGGVVKHALARRALGEPDEVAACGARVRPFDELEWRGTGSQAEYDRMARLPECRKCLRHLPPQHAKD